ncbi:pentapeptide repeat-containing protein [Candidatus Albibeggiatoa sp. nov. NOAA]|uniref:pentapeptide repeat-containing protein n=1 Tax=Candidatus Albibeggiatoa sp. nov. NOAA TaxID=3162724 RepID=UPI0032FB49C2|nr:pentapeptide repeat-containing protein [Thiotrichaceae bacterium]
MHLFIIALIGLITPLHLYAEYALKSEELIAKCGSIPPYYGYRFNQIEIDALLSQWTPLHEAWVNEHDLLQKSREELDTIIHFPFTQDARRINLCGANLQGLNLSKRDLSVANFAYANLQGTKFRYTNLIKTDLHFANLSEADFFTANISDANLVYSNLVKANLFRSLLSNTDFYRANLSQAIFYPSPTAIPDPLGLVPTLMQREQLFKGVKYFDENLGTYTPLLTLLRNEYRQRGMRDMERLITYLIQIKKEESYWEKGGLAYIPATLNWVFFNLTTQYGLRPQRALAILLTSVVLFTMIYWIALRVDSKHNQFEVIWTSKVHTSCQRRGVIKGKYAMDICQPLRFSRKQLSLIQKCLLEIKVFRVASYFSIITAFQIGWREYNIGEWISRLQSREFTLQIQKGWIRSVSGFQSLMNLYLLAIWMVTQFGRPFH